jgi:hypothetical protein
MPCRHDLIVPSCIHLVRLSKRGSSLITLRIDSLWKFLPGRVRLSSILEFEKAIFHSEYPLELLHQEDRVMEHNTRRAMKHSSILHGMMLPTHERKSGMGGREVFRLSTVPLSFLIRGQCIFYRFLCPSFINIGMRFLLRGKGCNTPCYKNPNQVT